MAIVAAAPALIAALKTGVTRLAASETARTFVKTAGSAVVYEVAPKVGAKLADKAGQWTDKRLNKPGASQTLGRRSDKGFDGMKHSSASREASAASQDRRSPAEQSTPLPRFTPYTSSTATAGGPQPEAQETPETLNQSLEDAKATRDQASDLVKKAI